MRKFNFNAGPSMLPREVVEQTAAAVLDYDGMGLSLMELSHRSAEFKPILDEARSLMKELLDVPQGYEVLFLGGGASMHFCMVPFNLLAKKAAYLNTGTWASKAIKEARLFGEAVEVASSADKAFSYIPKNFSVPADADYLHVTSNNTIYGTQLRRDIDSPVPLVADMSSDILSRPVDVSKYSCIYGGAQKNIAQSGLSFVIVRESALGKVERAIPSILDYRVHIASGSMFNTPPTLPIYTALCSLRWVKQQGGVVAMERRAAERAAVLYDEIERNSLFVSNVAHDDRSFMNIDFVMSPGFEALEDDFAAFAAERGAVAIKGHRSVGGFRASCYNAMPIEGARALAGCMKDFENKVKGI
ncbi:MAG: 3-phosphoserine/phosphohydroxythreonine transaminase [Bacteroidaceae bacterium]|nr:3-phosphoserine/phosphohydroxythreonine transaminase [Bacteroidaceae bacterium]